MAQAEGFPTAIDGPAAVDREGVAVDEAAGFVVGKECDGASDVIGRSKTSHGHATSDAPFRF